ncbi:hypothetical protein C0991_001280, partial [Blastosporella zonata]
MFYDEKIAPVVKGELSNAASPTERLNIIRRVTRELWNSEESNVVERVDARLDDLKAKKEAKKEGPPSEEEIVG